MRPIIWTVLDKVRLGWALRRNRWIADPALRGLARWFPPARLIARRYARSLFDLTAGFVYAQIASALVESGLLERLGEGPASLAEAARLARLEPHAVETLLKAAASLRLTEQRGGLWLLGPQGAALAASPGVAEMIRHHAVFYRDLADPLALLRGETEPALARLWRYDGSADPDAVAAYSALMAASQPMVAEQAIAAYPFRRHRGLLDLGGGTGAFLAAIGAVAPGLRLGLFDRPAVIDQVRAKSLQLEFHSGSFFDDSLPSGYDLISLVRVLHDHDDGPVSRLLAKVHAALPPDGRVLIVEPLAGTAGAEPIGHGYFGLYLTAMQSGRPRTFPEYKAMLLAAGFRQVRLHRTPLPLVASVISGRR
jgi:demethylspheroidene O-methyltransferase